MFLMDLIKNFSIVKIMDSQAAIFKSAEQGLKSDNGEGGERGGGEFDSPMLKGFGKKRGNNNFGGMFYDSGPGLISDYIFPK